MMHAPCMPMHDEQYVPHKAVTREEYPAQPLVFFPTPAQTLAQLLCCPPPQAPWRCHAGTFPATPSSSASQFNSGPCAVGYSPPRRTPPPPSPRGSSSQAPQLLPAGLPALPVQLPKKMDAPQVCEGHQDVLHDRDPELAPLSEPHPRLNAALQVRMAGFQCLWGFSL